VLPDKPPQILARREVELALAEKRPVRTETAVTCLTSQTIRELQLLFMEANQGLVLVLDKPGGKILGLVTLHDLLRAQVSLGKEAAGMEMALAV
jgi:CBS domain-containing protein